MGVGNIDEKERERERERAERALVSAKAEDFMLASEKVSSHTFF